MNERKGVITFQGKPLTLLGPELKPGVPAPDAELVGNDMAPVRLSSFRGRICVLSTVPSLDTPVCDVETRRFNEEAGKLGKDAVILTVSRDLPFAQKRWCGAAGVERVVTLSDYREGAFGRAYGIFIQELSLLARCLFVLDREGIIRDVQLVREITAEPDYAAVLAAVHRIAKGGAHDQPA